MPFFRSYDKSDAPFLAVHDNKRDEDVSTAKELTVSLLFQGCLCHHSLFTDIFAKVVQNFGRHSISDVFWHILVPETPNPKQNRRLHN